jgi:hypothetical protein
MCSVCPFRIQQLMLRIYARLQMAKRHQLIQRLTNTLSRCVPPMISLLKGITTNNSPSNQSCAINIKEEGTTNHYQSTVLPLAHVCKKETNERFLSKPTTTISPSGNDKTKTRSINQAVVCKYHTGGLHTVTVSASLQPFQESWTFHC